MQRVTQHSKIQLLLGSVQRSSASVASLQEQLATGKQLNRPSDNPSGIARTLRLRNELARCESLSDRAAAAQSFLTMCESALSSAQETLSTAHQRAIAAVNGALGSDDLGAIADEINSSLESLLDQARERYGDRYCFSGVDTLQDPFEVTRDSNGEITSITYAGAPDAVTLDLGQGREIEITVTGQEAFVDTGALSSLLNLRDTLRNTAGLDQASLSAAIRSAADCVDTARKRVLELSGVMGGRQSRLDSIVERYETAIIETKGLISKIEDADVAEVYTELTSQQAVYNALLSSSGKFFQQSLFDYL
ncbi:MAG TPA: flagellar hook-associated protein FlgL [Candidatus Brocadiia bacterium]|nr:flagellar hook-associated protein FlgL [Candidatus Brocadiia bacterium]